MKVEKLSPRLYALTNNMQPWTREHSYYMALCYDFHIAYEMEKNPSNTKRIAILKSMYDKYTTLHNSFLKTT